MAKLSPILLFIGMIVLVLAFISAPFAQDFAILIGLFAMMFILLAIYVISKGG